MASANWQIQALDGIVGPLEYSSFEHYVIKALTDVVEAVKSINERVSNLEARHTAVSYQDLDNVKQDIVTLQYTLNDVENKVLNCGWCASDKLGSQCG